MDIAVLVFSTAFVTVLHNRLLTELKHYGIVGNALAWIHAFLTNRTQRVLVEGHGSRLVSVRSGVHQGTVLGPFLFLVLTNDLPLSCSISDSAVCRRLPAVSFHLRCKRQCCTADIYLSSPESWSEAWGLRFNTQKCNVISTGK